MAPNIYKNIFMNFNNTLHITKILDSQILVAHMSHEFVQIPQAIIEELLTVTKLQTFPYSSI